jgi:hypothetical protein
LRLLCGMVSLGIQHGCHGLLHSLQHLLLHDQHFNIGGGGALPWLLSLLTLRFLVFAI